MAKKGNGFVSSLMDTFVPTPRGSGQDRARANQAYTSATNALRNQETLDRLRGMAGGGATAPSGGASRSGGGGGGGGGGGFDYASWQRQQEEERQRRLEQQKYQMSLQLIAARDQAMPMLQGYYDQYGRDISGIYDQNRGVTEGYNQQLQQLQGQMNQGTRGREQELRADIQGQGGGGPELQNLAGVAGQATAGTDFLSLLAQQYNTRLAQVMAQRQADAQSMGAAVNASSMGNLQNSYANLLGQIGMIGLS